ncbi:hypothetical protein K2Q02_01350 [Patescibacteria group bacterium]|nr:hypothetical protein [Patescibacteria group bacterium]
MKKLLLALSALFFCSVSITYAQTAPPRPTGIAGLSFWQNVPAEPHFSDLEKMMQERRTTYIKHEATGYILSPVTTTDSNGAQVNPNGRVTVWINQHNPNTGMVTPIPVSCEIFQQPNSWDTPAFRNASPDNPIVVSLVMSCKIDFLHPSNTPILKRFPIAANF